MHGVIAWRCRYVYALYVGPGYDLFLNWVTWQWQPGDLTQPATRLIFWYQISLLYFSILWSNECWSLPVLSGSTSWRLRRHAIGGRSFLMSRPGWTERLWLLKLSLGGAGRSTKKNRNKNYHDMYLYTWNIHNMGYNISTIIHNVVYSAYTVHTTYLTRYWQCRRHQILTFQ